MALLVFVITGKEQGVLIRGHRGDGERHPSSPARWFLNQKLTEGLGGLESQKTFLMERRVLQTLGDRNEPVGPGGRCWCISMAPAPCHTPQVQNPMPVPEETWQTVGTAQWLLSWPRPVSEEGWRLVNLAWLSEAPRKWVCVLIVRWRVS